jgi:predicted transcriptional regulator
MRQKVKLKRMVTITLDDETLERLDRLGENRSAVIRTTIAEMFVRKQPELSEA